MTEDQRLAHYFLFTQYSLTTFQNCPLKFKKRYLENLKWNRFPDDDIKRRIDLGNDFHLLAYRYFMGIDTGLEVANEYDEELQRWLDQLKKDFKIDPEATYLPEYKIRMNKGNYPLEANYDLLLVKGNTIEIWDWKTHAGGALKNQQSRAKQLEKSLQTIVYMFVLKEQVAMLEVNGQPCESIKMCYWQPETPDILAEIRYSDTLHQEFGYILKEKIEQVLNYNYETFDQSLYSKHCKFCEFNWFCNNERVDFRIVEEEEDFLEDLEWDYIEEKY